MILTNDPQHDITENLGFGEGLLAENGYQKLPGGLIIQWGVANENVTNLFPIPFPNRCFVLNATIRLNGSPWDGSVTAAYIISNSTFFAGCGDKTGDSMYWFAIGY